MPLDFRFDLAPPARHSGTPMRLLLLGDFSGHPADRRPPLAARPTHRIDLDTLDPVMERLAPCAATAQGLVSFAQLDDFHPDALFNRLPAFAALREARQAPPGQVADLLGALLGAPAPVRQPAELAPQATGLDALIQQIVAPHVVPDTGAQTRTHQAAVDAVCGELMRSLLHDPAFQGLESHWRGLQWLVSSLELGPMLELHLFDVTRDELRVDVVGAQGQLEQTGLHAALVDRWRHSPGGQGWSLIAGLHTFGGSDADIGLLAALGLVAAQAGGPYVAASDESVVAAPTDGWQALRASEAAPWIALAAPRLLLRVPYGAKSDPVASFTFEEIIGGGLHEDFLWGNPALALALLAGRGGDSPQIDDLPAFTRTVDGEAELLPCAERFLGDAGGSAMIGAGLVPLASHRNRHAVTVMRVQSVAAPPQALRGWP